MQSEQRGRASYGESFRVLCPSSYHVSGVIASLVVKGVASRRMERYKHAL